MELSPATLLVYICTLIPLVYSDSKTELFSLFRTQKHEDHESALENLEDSLKAEIKSAPAAIQDDVVEKFDIIIDVSQINGSVNQAILKLQELDRMTQTFTAFSESVQTMSLL